MAKFCGIAMKYVMLAIQNVVVELLNHLKMFGAENQFPIFQVYWTFRTIIIKQMSNTILLIPLNGVNTSPDSSLYLTNALKIYQNNFDYETIITTRRPFFPVLMGRSLIDFSR